MKGSSELMGILSKYLPWNKARLSCFVKMLLALFVTRTVNLSELAVAMSSKAQVSSRYRRLQRFFSEHEFNYDMIARFIFHLFFSKKRVYLTIDRTNWYWGKSKINIFMLAITYEGVAIPILWCLLNKAGNATGSEHSALIARFITLFGSGCIEGVLGDREFGNRYLFSFLNRLKIPFYIRIKDGSSLKFKNKKWCSVYDIFHRLNNNTTYFFPMVVHLYGEKVYLTGARSERGELMVIASNQPNPQAVSIYLRRWEIETLFSSLKTKGFRFEETHLTDQKRINKMMALLAIAFAWAHKVGEWRAIKKPIRFAKHKESTRPQNSFFRYGLDHIRDLTINSYRSVYQLKRIIRLLKLPDNLLWEAV